MCHLAPRPCPAGRVLQGSIELKGAGEKDAYEGSPDGAICRDVLLSVVNVGTQRGHDRVINWQEIYIGPSCN